LRPPLANLLRDDDHLALEDRVRIADARIGGQQIPRWMENRVAIFDKLSPGWTL